VCAQFAVRQGSGTYACHGRLSAWSRCTYTSRTAARLSGAVQLPAEARTELPASCKPAAPHQRGERVLPPPATTGKAAAATDEADAPPPFLSGVTLMLVGKLEGGRGAWAKKIEAAGGTVGTTVDASVVCVVTSQAELSRELESGRLYKARRMLIPVVSEAFLTASFAANKLASIPAHTLRGYEPSAGRGDGRRTNAASATVKLTGKAEVHEASGLVGRARVVTDGGLVYHATMTLADAAAGLNSFYILQALQTHGSAGEEGCWLFRAWGRVGDTRIGGNKLEQMPLAEATEQFEELFYEKSGNNFRRWAGGKEELVKRPGKFFPLEQDFGADKVAAAKAKAEAAKAKGVRVCPRL
jgi:predicted DNA-binding WGR domain protein